MSRVLLVSASYIPLCGFFDFIEFDSVDDIPYALAFEDGLIVEG